MDIFVLVTSDVMVIIFILEQDIQKPADTIVRRNIIRNMC